MDAIRSGAASLHRRHWKALGGGLWGAASPGTPQRSWAVASPCQELAVPVGPQRQPFSPPGRSLRGWLGGHPGPARLTLVSDGHRQLAPWLLPQPAGSHPAPARPGSRRRLARPAHLRPCGLACSAHRGQSLACHTLWGPEYRRPPHCAPKMGSLVQNAFSQRGN